jgi:hypothetical protein
MTETGSVLRFDRADYEKGVAGGPSCGTCNGPLAPEYWRWRALVFCSACRPGIEAKIAESQSSRAFAKAALQGTGVAIACGIAYAVFVGVSHMQLALVTIGIAYVVARVVRKASGGLGGRRFQILAVALTYFASTMGYAPGIVKGLKEGQEKRAAAAASGAPTTPQSHEPPQVTDVSEDHDPPASAGATRPPERDATQRGGGASVTLALVFLLGVMLVAPFLEITSAPMGVIIVLIGLWQAWKLTRGIPTAIEGPYRVERAVPAEGIGSREGAKGS